MKKLISKLLVTCILLALLPISSVAAADMAFDSTPVLDTFGDGVALLVGSPTAYAKKSLTEVDTNNPSVVPIIIDGRTLVPVRFISESFGAEVGWDGETRTVSVKLGGKNITLQLDSKNMVVDGKTTVLDVPAMVIEERTMIPLRAMVEAIGKEVTWDSRGLILIGDTTYYPYSDNKVIDGMLGYLKTGEMTVYNQNPRFTPEVMEFAFKQRLVYFNNTFSMGQGDTERTGSLALYYLAFATHIDPQTKSANGVLAKDRALEHIRNLIMGGKEPMCGLGAFNAYTPLTNALVMAKNTPAIWDELTAEEVTKVDLVMKSIAIMVNFGFNDANNYLCGPDLRGNFNKEWNPNYRFAYLPCIVNASLYFGGADYVNEIFTTFSYDAHMKELEAAGFTNIMVEWKKGGKTLMEKGGSASLIDGGSGGSGVGVKVEFKYKGIPLSDIEGIIVNLLEFAYGSVVTNDGGTKGQTDYAYIISGASSPFLGQNGMMTEFATLDGGGIRSDASYCYNGMSLAIPTMHILKMFGGWDGSTAAQKKCDQLIYVGTEDLIFKLQEGYMSHSKGMTSESYEPNYISAGYLIVKETWRKTINFAGYDTDYLIFD